MTWKVAGSLEQLRVQLDQIAPRRSRASDGSIGDAAHATRDSDHNPWLVIGGQAYVSARDFTHDPAGGLDCARLADALQRGRDPRVKYVIWNRQIMAGAEGPSPWRWRPYSGKNPHTHHLHLSVVADLRATVRIPWALPGALITPSPTPRPPAAAPPQEDDDMTPDQARMLQVVYDQLTGNNFAGWPTWQGGTEEALTLVDLARRDNVETRELHRNLNNGVHPKLDALLNRLDALAAQLQTQAVPAELDAVEVAATALTVDDVRRVLREALADLGPLYLTAEQTGA